MTTQTPDPTTTASEPNYDRIAAEMMQQWQQQFARPVSGPELTEAIGKSSTVAQNLMEMGQVLWQSWLQGPGNTQPDNDAATQDKSAAASADKTAYAAADVDAALRKSGNRDAPAAAPPVHGEAATGATASGVQPDAPSAASMAGVALCAELARRLDLLSQRVVRLESQLEQQLLNK